jgi:hypothetical protein
MFDVPGRHVFECPVIGNVVVIDERRKKKRGERPHRIIAMRPMGGVARMPIQYQFSPEAARKSCSDIESLAFWRVWVVSLA